MSELTLQLGCCIRTIRRAKDLTQERLAELADLNVTFLGQIERGAKSPTIDTIGKIANALQISLSELFEFYHYDGTIDAHLKELLLEYSYKIQKLYELEV